MISYYYIFHTIHVCCIYLHDNGESPFLIGDTPSNGSVFSIVMLVFGGVPPKAPPRCYELAFRTAPPARERKTNNSGAEKINKSSFFSEK